MTFLIELWLPILLSAVFVFIASSVFHMVLPLHKSDYKQLPGEDEIGEAMRAQSVPPGDYVFPYASSMAEMGSDEMKAKYERGPVGMVTVMPNGVPFMGKSLVWWFLYSLLIGLFTAYVGWHGLGADAPYLTVFRVIGATATLGYAFAYFPDSIWKGQSWKTSFKFVFDGLVYGVLTAGTFAWLWPEA